ncbi:MAG: hypothetical protein IJ634_07130 [Bacteroidales bacterium]|nr:hypothetical protein [Bacteroidales bacterium]
MDLRKEDYIDADDLEYILKDAVVGGVYFSKNAMEMVMRERASIHPLTIRPLIREIYETGCFTILDDDGILHCEGLKIDDFFNSSKFSTRLRFEHVIPYKYYSEEMCRLHDCGLLDTSMFKLCMKSINICIVLAKENSDLDRIYRANMPEGWRWGDNPFARYEKTNIEIWGGVGLLNAKCE